MQTSTAPAAGAASIDQIIGLIDEWRAHRDAANGWTPEDVVEAAVQREVAAERRQTETKAMSIEGALAALSMALDNLFEFKLDRATHQGDLVLSLLDSAARALRNRYEA